MTGVGGGISKDADDGDGMERRLKINGSINNGQSKARKYYNHSYKAILSYLV
jgi:hypothetical protein